MKTSITLILAAAVALTAACTKDYLDKKPSSGLVVPARLSELQELLENSAVMNVTGGLAQVSCDEYRVPDYTQYLSLTDMTSKNAYIWNADLYSGETEIADWNALYKTVFYANNVLDRLEATAEGDAADRNNLRGWALFARAFAFYDLAKNFSAPYDSTAAASLPGIPLRLKPGIDYTEQRATQEQTYRQVLSDLQEALPLLYPQVLSSHSNRPSKAAAWGLLARIYLDMGKYAGAERSADSSLALYSTLKDYNTVSLSSITPFGYITDETVYYAQQAEAWSPLTTATSATRPYDIGPGLLSLYEDDDLRLQVFFSKKATGNYNSKRRYTGSNYPFTGIATDELYLVKAECLARREQPGQAMQVLNTLLVKRYKSGRFVPRQADSREQALGTVLAERKKELVWRGLRWQDIKRLNREGAGITLRRELNGTVYTLPPNDLRYVFPIPPDEIAYSGIQQNPRQ